MPDLVSYRCSALLTALFAIANISPAQSSGELTANLARGVLQQGASNKDPETRRETARAFSLNSSRD